MLKSTMKKLFNLTPSVYGYIYLFTIPFYALLYYLFPHTLNEDISIIDSIYFSTITITTLGYGDLSPITDLGKILTASESIVGITLIGLFLNALSRVRIEELRLKDKKKERERYKCKQLAKLNGHKNIILPLLVNYKKSVNELTNIEDLKEYNKNFLFSDMFQLYDNISIASESFKKSEVKYYFETLIDLNQEITSLIKSVDLRLFPSLEKDCLILLNNTHSFDYSDFIIKSKNTKVGDESISTVVKEKIKEFKGEPRIDSSLDPVLEPYVALYFQVKNNMVQVENISLNFDNLISC